MSAILPLLKIDSSALLARYFTPYQTLWIQADDYLHAQGQQAFAIAEKSVRIGWTFCDSFKNVRKRLHYPKRDYLFATKNWPSALEYMSLVFNAIEFFNFTRAVVSHGEDFLKVNQLDPQGKTTPLTEEVKIGYVKFDNGSRIIAFSSNPQAMTVYGGDVGLDEFAKHPNAQLLWQTAQARVTWNYDMAVWSSHDGQDTLFNQFVQQARSTCRNVLSPGAAASMAAAPTAAPAPSPCPPSSPNHSPWNLYFRVTLPDAIELGLLDVINRVQGTSIAPEQFVANARSRAGSDEFFEQSYMCNPLGATSAAIVDWSAIERCRADYTAPRLHLEAKDVPEHFGQFSPSRQCERENDIRNFFRTFLPNLLDGPCLTSCLGGSSPTAPNTFPLRLGFDVAASGEGDLAVIYIDEVKGSTLWLRALITARTEDWHFLKTVLFFLLEKNPSMQAAGDETGLGRQICWEAASRFGIRFRKVNFASKKHDLGFTLMNQLAVAEKRFPREYQDIAQDYFALRKVHNGARWTFVEDRNLLNPDSHCDIAWAGALATHAHTDRRATLTSMLG